MPPAPPCPFVTWTPSAQAQVTVVNPYAQISGISGATNPSTNPLTIHMVNQPTSATITISVYHENLNNVGQQTANLEVGTYSSTPAGVTLTYTPATQPITLSGPAGNQLFSVTADAPSAGGAVLIIQSTLNGPSSKLRIIDGGANARLNNVNTANP